MESLSSKTGFLPGLFGRKETSATSGTSVSSTTKREKMKPPRPVNFFRRLPYSARNHFVAFCGELVGTFMFLFMAFAGTQVANSRSFSDTPAGSDTSQLLYISLSFSFSLAVNAWIFYRVSGGLFNPAVTLGLCLVGAIPFSRGFFVLIAQLLGAMAAAGVVDGLFPGPLSVSTTLGADTTIVQGLFIEMFLTAQLVFTIIMLAVEKHKGTFLAPVGIGLSLFIAELAGVYFTGGSLNPARSFGPCVVKRSFPGYHWLYWVGPGLGAIVAAGFFWFIKACEYETANPGQDFDDLEANAYNPEEDIARPVVIPSAHVERIASQLSDEARRLSSTEHRPSSSQGPMQPTRGRGLTNGSTSNTRRPEQHPSDVPEEPLSQHRGTTYTIGQQR